MYEQHFGLTEKPFSLSPDPSFLYFSRGHLRAMTMLEYGLTNQAGFTLISGEVGCGKTTLIRRLLSNLDDSYEVGLISNTHAAFGDLMDLVLHAYDLDYANQSSMEKYRIFEKFLIDKYSEGKNTVLVVDEAQNLSAEMLEELRVISNINSEKDQVLQVILSGQPEIRDTLKQPSMRQFAQRISSDFHLEPLDLKQIEKYIKHRVKTAGCERDLFTSKAAQLIFKFSHGIPRLINSFCDMSLVYAYADDLNEVDWRTVMRVAVDRKNQGSLGIL